MAITNQEAISTVSKVVEAANIAEAISSLCKLVDSDNILLYSSPGKYEVAFKITDLLRNAITTLGIVFDESETHIRVRDTNLVDMMAILYDNDKCGYSVIRYFLYTAVNALRHILDSPFARHASPFATAMLSL